MTPAASTAPAAPTVLTATSGNQQVGLTWVASSSATSYHVKRATTSGGPYTQAGSATVTSYTDAGLTNGTKYFYVVSALNTAGESANSSEASGTPTSPPPTSPAPPPPAAPAAPASLAAAAGNQQVSLTWTASSGAASYHVKRATTSWWAIHPGGCANDDQLLRHWSDQRHDLLLCCVGAECDRRERKLKPGQRDTFRRGARCDRYRGSDAHQAHFAVDLRAQFLYRRLWRSAAPHP